MVITTNVQTPRLRWNGWDCAFLVVSVLITASAFFNARFGYYLGSGNHSDMGMGGVLISILGCGAWFIPVMFAAVMVLVRRPPWSRVGIYLGISLLPFLVGISTFKMSDVGYRHGFQVWIMREVNPEPIQAWLAKQAVTPDVVILAPADWPPEINRLHPERVDLWRERGVVLTWGQVGHGGDRRQVFIGRNTDTPPPTEVLWRDDAWKDAWKPIEDHWSSVWESIKPGVWWWLIYGS